MFLKSMICTQGFLYWICGMLKNTNFLEGRRTQAPAGLFPQAQMPLRRALSPAPALTSPPRWALPTCCSSRSSPSPSFWRRRRPGWGTATCAEWGTCPSSAWLRPTVNGAGSSGSRKWRGEGRKWWDCCLSRSCARREVAPASFPLLFVPRERLRGQGGCSPRGGTWHEQAHVSVCNAPDRSVKCKPAFCAQGKRARLAAGVYPLFGIEPEPDTCITKCVWRRWTETQRITFTQELGTGRSCQVQENVKHCLLTANGLFQNPEKNRRPKRIN